MFPILAATAIATPENVTDPAPKTEKSEDTHSSESLVEILVLSGKTHEPRPIDLPRNLWTLQRIGFIEGFTRVTNGDMAPEFPVKIFTLSQLELLAGTMNHPDYQRQGARPSAGGNLTSMR